MNLHHYFLASSYFLVAVSFLMVVATGRCDVVSVLLFSGVLITSWLIDTGRLVWAGAKRWSNWMMIGFLFFAFAEWRIAGVELVTVLIHITFFASSLKLLRLKSPRDWLLIYLVSFFLTLMTAGISANAQFLFLLVCYLFAGLSTLISYEIRHTQLTFATAASERNPGTGIRFDTEYWKEIRDARQKRRAPGGRSLFAASILTLAAILLLALPLFLVMPRLARAGSRYGLLNAERLSGFSDTVRLGEVAQIKLNPQVVMRVRVRYPAGEPPRGLRWRGGTLNYYDGQSWSESERDPIRVKRVEGGFKVDERIWMRAFTEQRFFLEPISSNVVFAAPRPVFVTGLRDLSRDKGDGLWTEDHSYFKLDYIVYSDAYVPSDAELAADNSRDYPREIAQRYLQLPHDHDLRITGLAAQITKGATTQIEIARRIENYLRNNYSYTLDMKRVEDGDPIADFLFNLKAGHCEYFASAMVLMLRTRRIPARLVVGFQQGEYNQTVDVYTVRQSDAHAWVEVFFPKSGWITFEPTASAGLNDYDDGLGAMFRQYSEAIEMFWLEHVVGFDTNQQLSMARAAQSWLAMRQMELNWLTRWRIGEWIADLSGRFDLWRSRRPVMPERTEAPSEAPRSTGFTHPVLITLFALVCVTGLILVWRRQYSSWRRNAKQDSGASAIAFYQEMLKRLERAGHKREPYQTPQEFAEQLEMPVVREITRLYQQARFGQVGLSEEQVEHISSMLRQLASERKRPRPLC